MSTKQPPPPASTPPADPAAAAGAPAAGAATGVKKKIRKSVPHGIVHIMATFNNTVITVTDVAGNTITWCSSGTKGFKGSRKSTPFAAQVAADEAIRQAMDAGMKSAVVLVKGPGAGREAALRAVAAAGLKVTLVKDVTPLPHNGCRPPKRRRV